MHQIIPADHLEEVASRFRLLSDPVRLELLNQLLVYGERNVQALVAATGHQQANVSKHLRLLLEAGMVARRQEGLYAYYQIADPSLSGLCLLVCGQVQARRQAAVGA